MFFERLYFCKRFKYKSRFPILFLRFELMHIKIYEKFHVFTKFYDSVLIYLSLSFEKRSSYMISKDLMGSINETCSLFFFIKRPFYDV